MMLRKGVYCSIYRCREKLLEPAVLEKGQNFPILALYNVGWRFVTLSQVIVTNDALSQKREKSREQERRISREDSFQHWRRSDITGHDGFKAMVGYGVVPILALWGLLAGLGAVVLDILNVIFKVLGRMVGGSKSLILGGK